MTIYGNSVNANEISIFPFLKVIKLGLYFVTGILILLLLLLKIQSTYLSGLGVMTAGIDVC